VDRELIETMRSAGCGSLFFGVETGSTRLQKIIGKDLGIEEAAAAVELVNEAGMRSTVSLIVGFPEETKDDLNATASFGLNAARFDSATVQVAMLAALAGTPLHRKWREELIFDGMIPEQSQQSLGQDDADRDLIRRHPDLFSSFYGVPAGTGREYVGEFRWFFRFALKRCRWLAVALGRHRKPFTEVFDLWRSWRPGARSTQNYFRTFEFAEDLCRFVAECLAAGDSAMDPVPMMAFYYGATQAVLREPERGMATEGNQLPGISSNLTILDFPFSPSRIIDALRERKPIGDECLQATAVACQREGPRIVDMRELPAVAATVLRLCDGRTTAAQIVQRVGHSLPVIPGVSAETFVLAGLESLAQDGLVQMPPALHPV
jgi:hypothetical protein